MEPRVSSPRSTRLLDGVCERDMFAALHTIERVDSTDPDEHIQYSTMRTLRVVGIVKGEFYHGGDCLRRRNGPHDFPACRAPYVRQGAVHLHPQTPLTVGPRGDVRNDRVCVLAACHFTRSESRRRVVFPNRGTKRSRCSRG